MEECGVGIAEIQRENADKLFPLLLCRVREFPKEEKKVIVVSGGSGAGKTGMAWLLKQRFDERGIPALIISGDNYPRRVPFHNDAERVSVFRLAGMDALLLKHLYTASVCDALKTLQAENLDADESLAVRYPWLEVYQKSGDAALADYLGTEKELLFSEVSSVLSAFKRKEPVLWLRQMGRQAHEIWYEQMNVSDKEVLILEWTHGNSALLRGTDVSVVLKSTPEQTLENRKRRNRDKGIDSPFVARVLRIEQEKIETGLQKADLIQDMQGNLIDKDHISKEA